MKLNIFLDLTHTKVGAINDTAERVAMVVRRAVRDSRLGMPRGGGVLDAEGKVIGYYELEGGAQGNEEAASAQTA